MSSSDIILCENRKIGDECQQKATHVCQVIGCYKVYLCSDHVVPYLKNPDFETTSFVQRVRESEEKMFHSRTARTIERITDDRFDRIKLSKTEWEKIFQTSLRDLKIVKERYPSNLFLIENLKRICNTTVPAEWKDRSLFT